MVMNRHTSNPFLSDWDEAAQDGAPPPARDQQQAQAQQPARRSSCSQAEFGPSAAGAAARQHLYRRNMSSFEAASLQLEQQQQLMLENGCSSPTALMTTDLIAKMTADFQSAISTNDKQFALDAAALDFNPFDPFETIVDDDVSLGASPAQTAGDKAAEQVAVSATGGKAHDSIDDDEDELVSTPVRTIKTSESSHAARQPAADSCSEPSTGERTHERARQPDPQDAPDSDSRARASLFASLLASAEQPVDSVAVGAARSEARAELGAELDDEQLERAPQQLAEATHVIKGSPSSATGGASDAASERPVGFFDPFETVIDRDALCALMGSSAEQAAKPVDGQRAATSERGEVPADDTARRQQYDSSTALGRPAGRKLEQPASGFAAPQPTPLRKPKQQQQQRKASARPRRNSFQEDSSSNSSDEEDDRIQIVIKDKPSQFGASRGDAGAECAPVVPLLPPPPSRSTIKQARERGQVSDMPSPIMSYKSRLQAAPSDKPARRRASSSSSSSSASHCSERDKSKVAKELDEDGEKVREEEGGEEDRFVITMRQSELDDETDDYGKSDSPLYDHDTSYQLEEFAPKHDASSGWEMMLRYPPKKKITGNRYWKKIFVKLAQVPLLPSTNDHSKPSTKSGAEQADSNQQQQQQQQQTCWALQIFDKQEDKKPMQEIPIQATYTVTEINSQLFDQFGKIFTIKLQYIFYKERVGVRQGQLARFIHTGHIGTSTTSGGHGVDGISIGAIKRMGAPIEHSPQVSQIIKLGCMSYEHMKQFKEALEDCLFRMPIQRERALSTYKTEEVQMAVRDETYIEVNQVGTITRQLARVRLFFLSFLNGQPSIEVGINDIHRQGREVVGRMDILPVATEEWIRLEACELHSSVDQDEFEKTDSRLIKLSPPDATFFELMRFRVRPPRNRELPLQISANMSVTRTRVAINCEVIVPGCVSRKHGQIACENIAIRVHIPQCWIYFFREEKHFRMGSKKSVNRRPGKVKGIERFLGGAGAAGSAGLHELDSESALIEVTSGQAKYEHHHQAVVWRAAKWPKESQSAYVQNSMKIRLPLTAYDKMPDSFSEYLHAEYTMPATTVSHTTLRSIAVAPCDDEPPEKYVKYSAKYEYKVKMRLSVNLGAGGASSEQQVEASPIVIMKQPDLGKDLHKEEDLDDDDDDDDDDDADAKEYAAEAHERAANNS